MRRDPRKSNDEKQGTELVIKLNGQVVFEKATVKNLTMSDTIVLAVSLMFLPVYLHGTLIESGNLQPKQNTNEDE